MIPYPRSTEHPRSIWHHQHIFQLLTLSQEPRPLQFPVKDEPPLDNPLKRGNIVMNYCDLLGAWHTMHFISTGSSSAAIMRYTHFRKFFNPSPPSHGRRGHKMAKTC